MEATEIPTKEEKLETKNRNVLHELLKVKRQAVNDLNHIDACLASWQSYAIVCSFGEIQEIHEHWFDAVKAVNRLNENVEDYYEDQRVYYRAVPWKWNFPLDPDDDKSILVHPDIWVSQASSTPYITRISDGYQLIGHISPADPRLQIFNPEALRK